MSVVSYPKGSASHVSDYFSSTDFDCRCNRPSCKETLIDEDLAESLDHLHEMAGPFKINSGYRCEDHNRDVGGELNSFHKLGMAVDIQSLTGLKGIALARYAEKIPYFENGGIGIAEKWIHADVRRNGPARWKYPR